MSVLEQSGKEIIEEIFSKLDTQKNRIKKICLYWNEIYGEILPFLEIKYYKE